MALEKASETIRRLQYSFRRHLLLQKIKCRKVWLRNNKKNWYPM